MIDIFDNRIEKVKEIFEEIINLPYYYGETDNLDSYPTGMVSELNRNHQAYQELLKFCKKENLLSKLKINRAYVNIFAPSENANYHVDSDQDNYKTILYYPHLDFNINEGGETKFVSENNTLVSILPIPGRIIVFNSNLKHTASPFKNKHRFSIAVKLIDN